MIVSVNGLSLRVKTFLVVSQTETKMEVYIMFFKNKKRMNSANSKKLAQFLSSALFLEEQFSSNVYRDYLELEDWPVNLRPDVFDEIKRRLIVLIDDSAKQEKVIHGLSRQYGDGKYRDKKRILKELKLMEGFELSAKEFYIRISSDTQLGDERLREEFKLMAETERRHAKIVQEIIELLNNA
jgi:hypothetical protein